MNFVPENQEAQKVPYFEDARKEDGWQGHTTTKSIDRLKAEISDAVSRLGGFVSGFQKGAFIVEDSERDGFQVYYSIGNTPGRIDIAALPVRNKRDALKRDKSLRMALFMLREGLDGMWFMQKLSPGYSPLMPFTIVDGEGHTMSQIWETKQLMPPPESDFVEAEEL